MTEEQKKEVEKAKTVYYGLKTGFSIVAGIGIDTMLTSAANAIVPGGAGIVGLIQKVCVKVGSVGLSMVAAKAIGNLLPSTEVVEETYYNLYCSESNDSEVPVNFA